MKEDLSAGNYVAAFQLYAADCDQMITRARDDNPFSEKDLPHESLSPLVLPICLIIGLVAALILFTIFSKGREARVRKKIYKSIRIFRGGGSRCGSLSSVRGVYRTAYAGKRIRI